MFHPLKPAALVPVVAVASMALALAGSPCLAQDTCATAKQVRLGNYDGSLIGRGHDGETGCDSGVAGNTPTAWYLFTSPCDGSLVVTIRAGFGGPDTVLSIYSGCPGDTMTEVACNDNVEPNDTDSQIIYSVASGQTLWIRVSTYDDSPERIGDGAFTLYVVLENWPCCEAAERVTHRPTYFGFSLQEHTAETGCDASLAGATPDAWYLYTALRDGDLIVDTTGSRRSDGAGPDTVVSIHTGCPADLANEVVCNDDLGPGIVDSRVTYPIAAGEELLVRVSTFDDSPFRVGDATYTVALDLVPSNDQCATPDLVYAGDTVPATLTGPRLSHTAETGCDSLSAGSTPDAWYLFVAPCAGTLSVDADGSRGPDGFGPDTVLSLFNGCPSGGGVEIACDDDGGTGVDSRIDHSMALGDEVWIRVSTFDDSANRIGYGDFQLHVAFAAPSIDCCSGATEIIGGETYASNLSSLTHTGETSCDSLTAGATPEAWFAFAAPCGGLLSVNTNGSNNSDGALGGPDTVLSLHSSCPGDTTNEVACDDDGGTGLDSSIDYHMSTGENVLIRVSVHSAGAVANGLYIVHADFFANAPEDCCSMAPAILDGQTIFGNLTGLTGEPRFACGEITYPADLPEAWYRFTSPYSGTLVLDTIGSRDNGGPNAGPDTTLSVWSSCPETYGSPLTCIDDGPGLGLDARLEYEIAAGETVWARISIFDQQPPTLGNGAYRFHLALTPDNNECIGATPIGETTVTGDMAGATGDSGDDSFCGVNDTIDRWFAYTASAGGTATITTCHPGTQFDTVLSVFDACGGSQLTCNDDAPGAPPECTLGGISRKSTITLSVTAGTTYFIRLSVYNDDFTGTGGTGSLYELSITLTPPCPCEFDGNDGQVDVFDLLAYLALWFPQDPAADIDGAPGVDVFDLLEYLSCWFPASAGTPCP